MMLNKQDEDIEKDDDIQRMKKWAKEWSPLATAVTAVFLVLFGFKLWELNSIDVGPTLSISDVQLEMVDTTNSVVRTITMSKGDNNNRTIENINRNVLLIKIKNTGKKPGIIKFYELKANCLNNSDKNRAILMKGLSPLDPIEFREPILVAGTSETSWIFGQDILQDGLVCENGDIKYTYKLWYGSQGKPIIKLLESSVLLRIPVTKESDGSFLTSPSSQFIISN